MAAVARTPSPARSSAVTVCPSGPTAAAQPGSLEVAGRPGQHLPLGAAEGQDRGAAAEGLPDHLIVTVAEGALGQGFLDRLARTVAAAGRDWVPTAGAWGRQALAGRPSRTFA